MTKEDFLNRYNQTQSIEEALRKSMNAAVQRNMLYQPVPNNNRIEIREHWSKLLCTLTDQFQVEAWNEDVYENKIIYLRTTMNEQFGNFINFRISHAQKSLGVFFKHLWCLNLIQNPPQCPIDRIILTRAGAPYSERSWGFIDDIETHRQRFELIRLASNLAGFDNVCEWELEVF